MITNCTQTDLNQILTLYQDARDLQTERKMVVWPHIPSEFILNEIDRQTQFKISINGQMVCNWAITFNDHEIWEHRDKDDSIYIHRICTQKGFRGHRYIDRIVDWGRGYAKGAKRKYVRLDTLGNNTKLIEHYKSAGFNFLGMFRLTNIASLAKHYQDEPNCCLFEMEV